VNNLLETSDPEALQTFSEVLAILRERLKPGQTWYCYENVALDSANLGHHQFLCCGEGCTFFEPPTRMPDTSHAIGWKYLLIGHVDMETGEIVGRI
jgi:hypothetical protein